MKPSISFLLSLVLAACHCHTISTHPTDIPTDLHTVSKEPAVTDLTTHIKTEPAAKMAVSSAPQTVAATVPSATKSSQRVPATVTEQETDVPEQHTSVFTPTAAAQLIAQDRAAQTLTATPTDTPVFKKEELLPTQGRLLNPLAYEPIQPDHTQAPWSNESLQYGLYYSFIKAGTAYIKTRGLVSKNGKTAYLIQTTAFSASVIDSVFKVRDINYSWIDTKSLHSLGYSQSVREGNYKRDEWLSFDHENGRFYGEIQKKSEPRVIAGELDQEALDMLSSLYFVRTQPLEIGKDIVFDIVNREKQYPLVVKVLGKETVKTPAGKFNCWLVEPQIRGEGIFVVKGKSLKVWLTDDKYRMPVKMSVEVFIGSVSAELLDYKRN